MQETSRRVTLRLIARPADREGVLSRVAMLCQSCGMVYTVSEDVPYWKIPDRMDTHVELDGFPTQNYGKWSEIYRYLFERDLTISWETEETICFYTYPPVDSEDMWVDFRIPSPCFWPKPSKDIRH